MDEYLRNMKTLRSQMNDFEEEAANVSAEEQRQITAIQTTEKDLNSVLLETKHLKEETDEILKAKGQLCCKILENQKKISSFEIESSTLSQVCDGKHKASNKFVNILSSMEAYSREQIQKTLELLQQDRVTLSEKLREQSCFFEKVQKDLCAKLQNQQEWLNTRQATLSNGEQYHDPKKVFTEGNVSDMLKCDPDSRGKNAVECSMVLKSSNSKLEENMARKPDVNISKSKQLIEQLKLKNELPAEVKGMDLKTLERVHHALLSDKAGELEYLHSLKDQIEQVQGIAEVVKCQCGEEYSVNLTLT